MNTTAKDAAIILLTLLLMQSIAYAGISHAKPLSQYTNKELIKSFEKCLTEEEDTDKASDIYDELINRKAIKETVALFKKDEGSIIEGWCFGIIEKLRGPETGSLLKPLANRDHSERAYYANKYFAEIGEKFALENLDANYWDYLVSGNEWSETILLFGNYKYYPAKKNLLSTIRDGNLNVGGSSAEALMLLYPETRKKVEHLGIHDTFKFYSSYIISH